MVSGLVLQTDMSCFPFLRLMMVLFNLLVSLGGLVLLAGGIWVSVDGSSFLHILGPFCRQVQLFVNTGFFCVSVGTVLVLLGLLGSCGARKESKCLLVAFFSIILIIVMAEVAAGLVALIYSSLADRILEAWATQALQNSYGLDPKVTKIWNSTMTEFSCCGFSGHADFTGSEFQDQNQDQLPPSCCWTNTAPCRPEEAELLPVQGCSRPVLKLLREQSHVVGGVAAGVAALEVNTSCLKESADRRLEPVLLFPQVAGLSVCTYLYTHLDRKSS
ncbi:tetraspanin-1 [Austrofundulus limnaeus]|uniref:Tetraspanin n=1 Tax=Austrofundulus limnaeus TaxID=52670 RepID=A0A2I4D3X0_AUSLI|nr:PREDICTED: tetraspanin-1 [Austrofundulus limnaeus]